MSFRPTGQNLAARASGGLAIEMAGPAVGPAQHNGEQSESDDKRCYEQHFSCRHDLLLLLPLSAAMVANPAPIALIRINLPSPWYWNSRLRVRAAGLTQVNRTQSTFGQTKDYY